MASILSALSVGSTISLKVDGTAQKFIIVHQGNPDAALYDASCDGTWLMMKDLHSKRSWGSVTGIHTWLNENFLPLLDSTVQGQVKTVKIPYLEGSSLHTAAEGLETRIFLLSGYELGWTSEDKTGMAADGKCLKYFEGFSTADSRRVASLDGTPTWYWTRSLYAEGSESVWVVSSSSGDCAHREASSSYGIRPILILPSSLLVDDSGNIQPNAAPTITSPSGTNGASLGIRNAPFVLEYTASDPEGADVTLTEQLDTQTTRTLTAASGAPQHFGAVNDSKTFLPLANGSHTLKVTASDGMASSSLSLLFTRAVTSASLTMVQPMVASSPISVAALTVGGTIPADADYTVEVTNNALDPEPVWQDATAAVREGHNILFDNKVVEKSPAFNFRIQVARGTSGTGGFINSITGAFQ